MIRQSSGAIVARPAPVGEKKTLIVMLTVQGVRGSGRDRFVYEAVNGTGGRKSDHWCRTERTRFGQGVA